jgi:hypothetical protein
MHIETLNLIHQPLLADRLKSLGLAISEYSFANLYLFRERHGFEIIQDEELFIRGKGYDGHTYLMPTRDVREMAPDYLEQVAGTVDFLYPVPEEWLAAFPEEVYDRSYSDDDSDYVYLTEKIATYAGKKLHKKKNLLNYFRKHYVHSSEPLTEDRLEDAMSVLNEWQCESGQDEVDTDFAACREALQKSEELILCGGIWYTEGQPSGFILGEELGDDSFALHFAKALTKFKGIYQYIFSSFAGVLPGKYTYLNFEQDLGNIALRQSKASYYPERKTRKYRLSAR